MSYKYDKKGCSNESTLAEVSTDPYGKDMVPPEGRRAKQLSWDGFWLTESELNFIVDAVIAAYYYERSSANAI